MIDAVFWLGDNPGHNVYEQKQSDHLNSLEYVTKKLKATFPRLGQVYPVLGNHEAFPVDQFDVHGHDHQWILDTAANLWKQWFTNESYNEFIHYGRYSQIHPGTSLRIIGLNTFVFDCINSYIWSNNSDPQHEIEWLERTLDNSEKLNESVLIIGHIPPSLFDSDTSKWIM